MLAAHAAIAITNARLHEESRELSIVAERNRLALDLHDAVSQKLFGLVLSAEAAGTLLERDPAAAREQIEKLRTLAQEALDELRSLVFELRPPELEKRRPGRCAAQARRGACGAAAARDRAGDRRAGRRPGPRPRGAAHRPGGPAERTRVTRTHSTFRYGCGTRTGGCCSRSRTTAWASSRTRPTYGRGGSG